MVKSKNHIINKLDLIPKSTGVYCFYNNKNVCIYVGKAKNLKNRVSSYFFKKNTDIKTAQLVKNIKDLSYVVVNSEMDALLLENNLIKKNQPRYNVLLKDGKTYPWICISHDSVPKIYQTRNIDKKAGDYFGPFMSGYIVKTLLGLFSDLFYNQGWTPISYVNREIKDEKELKNYLDIISDIKKILTGNIFLLINNLKKNMSYYSKTQQYERAHVLKNKLDILANYQAKSLIVSPKIDDIDVVSIVSKNQLSIVNFIKIKHGCVISAHSVELHKKLNETEEDLLTHAVISFRQKKISKAIKILSSHQLKNVFSDTKIIVPKIGDKKKLVDLSLKNAKLLLLEKSFASKNNIAKKKTQLVLKNLKLDLGLKIIPKHIECFDNSNFQGKFPVASCVVFKDGKPSKKEYRIFNIKTVVGPDDFASMKEVIERRYKRMVKEKAKLPQLIVVDGGKGQLSSAFDVLKKLNLHQKINLIGIAKKLEEIFMVGDKTPLYLDKRSSSLKLIQHLRDESHRFAIKHHRNRREKNKLKTSLRGIKGIGDKTEKLLIITFGSVNNAINAGQQELTRVVGKSKAKKIFNNYF